MATFMAILSVGGRRGWRGASVSGDSGKTLEIIAERFVPQSKLRLWRCLTLQARLLRLLDLLQSRPDWTGTELAERLAVTTRTVRKDVTRLRDLGYPVDANPGVAGGYRLAAGAHLPPLLLDDDEAVAVAIGLRAAAHAGIVGIEETSMRAVAKLEQMLPNRLRRRVSALQSAVESVRWGAPDALVETETLAVFSQACRDTEQVRFDYADKEGKESRRLVEPHKLVTVGQRWYLVAWDVRRDDWRTFRVDRTRAAPRRGAHQAPAAARRCRRRVRGTSRRSISARPSGPTRP